MEYTEQVIAEIGKSVFANEIAALNSAMELINGSFSQAAMLIAKSERIVISGVGKSGLIGKKIAATFSSIGKPAYFMHPVDALHGDIGIIQSGDTVLLLSKSGSTDEIVRLMPYIKSRSAYTIALVSDKNSYLGINSDICLHLPIESEACPLNIVPTSSTTSALAMGDALAVAVMRIGNITLEDFSLQHPLGQIGRNITLRVKDIMHKGENIPKIAVGSSFKNAIIAMSDKKLGCVCVCDSSDKLFGLITDGDVRRILQKYDNIGGLIVDEIMTKAPTYITQDLFLGEALSVMSNRTSQISVLPVLDDEHKVLGVIRVHDIVRSGI